MVSATTASSMVSLALAAGLVPAELERAVVLTRNIPRSLPVTVTETVQLAPGATVPAISRKPLDEVLVELGPTPAGGPGIDGPTALG